MGKDLFLALIDEYYFFPPRSYEVILPLVANGTNALIMCSSISSHSGTEAINQMHQARDRNGNLLVHEVNFFQACEDCIRLNKENECRHVQPRPQSFQRHGGRERLQGLMESFGDAYARELENRIETPNTSAFFPRERVEWLFGPDGTYDNLGMSIPHVLIAIDPSAGHRDSKYAIVSMYFTKYTVPGTGEVRTRYVLLGGEIAEKTDNKSVAEYVAIHILAIRRLRGFERCSVTLDVEANLPGIASGIWEYVHHIPRTYTVMEAKQTTGGQALYSPGRFTTSANRTEMLFELRDAIDKGDFRCQKDFLVTRPKTHEAKTTGKSVKTIVKEHFLNFMDRMVWNKDDLFEKAKHKYDGKGPGTQDDFVMAISLGRADYFAMVAQPSRYPHLLQR